MNRAGQLGLAALALVGLACLASSAFIVNQAEQAIQVEPVTVSIYPVLAIPFAGAHRSIANPDRA